VSRTIRKPFLRVSAATMARLRAYAAALNVSAEELAERAIDSQCRAIAGPKVSAAVEAEDLLGEVTP
jgi:hypothetical protein